MDDGGLATETSLVKTNTTTSRHRALVRSAGSRISERSQPYIELPYRELIWGTMPEIWLGFLVLESLTLKIFTAVHHTNKSEFYGMLRLITIPPSTLRQNDSCSVTINLTSLITCEVQHILADGSLGVHDCLPFRVPPWLLVQPAGILLTGIPPQSSPEVPSLAAVCKARIGHPLSQKSSSSPILDFWSLLLWLQSRRGRGRQRPGPVSYRRFLGSQLCRVVLSYSHGFLTPCLTIHLLDW